MSTEQKQWESFLEAKGWAVGVDQDSEFFLYDVHEDYVFDEDDLYWGNSPIASGYSCEADLASSYGFNLY